ncbi:hypothetical protein GCM10010372_75970 [Streptomyces tauricus]|uniref:IS110 family transposase n=1 Tax=Streptomyces tauricus TaxID=68274 RepID=UPI001989B08A|nr:IS110 family transposase [Streptomyces tauricus]GHA65016.1 hypothetical protein GCM10010372_75970 [Streptomyces tauricus]
MNTNEQHMSGHVVIGVDTHKHVHVAAVMDTIGGILATLTIPTDTGGFQQLLDWATSFGKVLAFGVEGTGSYGATLASFLRRAGHKVVEAGRPDRRLRRMNGKSDTLDAENAARAVLAGFATAIPKTADGGAEMIRRLKIAHDQAVEQRAAAPPPRASRPPRCTGCSTTRTGSWPSWPPTGSRSTWPRNAKRWL